MNSELKVCHYCGTVKPVESFHKNNSNSDGLQSRCKQCVSGYAKGNKARIRENRNEWAVLNKEKIKAYAEKYRADGKKKPRTPEQCSWHSMNQRCNNPKDPSFPEYGGRGIAICEQWSCFSVFLRDMGKRPNGTTIDRIDSDKGYFPENCRWATRVQQQNNIRRNVLITIDGVSMTLAEWVRRLGRNYGTIHARIQRGMAPAQALKTPNKYDRLKAVVQEKK